MLSKKFRDFKKIINSKFNIKNYVNNYSCKIDRGGHLKNSQNIQNLVKNDSIKINYLNSFPYHITSSNFATYYKKEKSELKFETVYDILNNCNAEPHYINENMKAKYCPLCDKPHNDDPTNLNTFIIYKSSMIYFCFRCGNKGHVLRLIKILSKKFDLSEYKDLIGSSMRGYSSNGNTTENDDYISRPEGNEQMINRNNMDSEGIDVSRHTEEVGKQNSKSDYNNNSYNDSNSKPFPSSTPINTNQNYSKENFKISINNIFLINELYRRNLLLSNEKCQVIYDYLTKERKLTPETLSKYNVGVSYERFKSNSYEFINLPCVTYPMFYPTDKNALLTVEKGSIEDSLYNFYKCDKFYLSRLKVRAIGKEFKHFQRMEPNGSVLYGLFGLDTVPDDAEEIIITEGEYDAMAAYQCLKIPAVSLPNGASNLPTQLLPYFKRFKRIYLWMDADQAGQIAAENFTKKLGEKKTLIINTRKNDPQGPKDANDALMEGKDLSDYLQQAKHLSGDNIIKLSDIKSEIIQFLSQYERYSGYKATSFDFFNKKLKGLRMGEFSIFTGETGSGKTTFLSQLSLDFIAQRIPTLWGSFEIKNDKLASLFLMQQAKKNLRLSPIAEIEFNTENFEKLPLYMLKFHGSQNIDEIINSMNFAVYNYDIQNIVLDNLQFMIGTPSKTQNKFDFQDEIIHRLRKFATEKNVHVTLVIHPRKDEILKISSIFGTGKASQEADNIYILQSYKGLRILEIAKNRFDGTTGKVALAFDNDSCRFFELSLDEFSKVVKNNVKIDEIIKDRVAKYGSIEPNLEDIANILNANENNLIDSFVSQKEKEINRESFNNNGNNGNLSKDKYLESDENLFGRHFNGNNRKNNSNSYSNSNRDDIVTDDVEIEISNSSLNEIKRELNIINTNPTISDKESNINKDNVVYNNSNKITHNLKQQTDLKELINETDPNLDDSEINKIYIPKLKQENDISLDLNTFSDIKNFQQNFFPKSKTIETFHDQFSQEKTNSNSISFKPRTYNSQNNKNDQRVRQSTFKVSRDSIIDDIF